MCIDCRSGCLCPLCVVLAVPSGLVHLEELFDLRCVLVLQQIADFFKPLKRLVWAVLHNVVHDVRDMFV